MLGAYGISNVTRNTPKWDTVPIKVCTSTQWYADSILPKLGQHPTWLQRLWDKNTHTYTHTHCSFSQQGFTEHYNLFKIWLEQQVLLLISSRNSALLPQGFISTESDWAMINLCCGKMEVKGHSIQHTLNCAIRHKLTQVWRLIHRRAGRKLPLSECRLNSPLPGEEYASTSPFFRSLEPPSLTFYNAIQQGDNNVAHMQNLLAICKTQSLSSGGRQSW